MQYIDGENLAQRINSRRPMPLEEIIDLSKQICRGLRYAHGMQVIHRDIKPQNVLLDRKNVARLSDFGIARMVSSSHITMTGVTVGTPEYMSPEQASGKELSTQTDIYSLGILIYEMLTKEPPFTADNPVAVAYKQVHEIPVPPSARRKDTPKRLELIVLKALKKNLAERYSSVDEMLEHLDSVDINETVSRTTMRLKSQKIEAAPLVSDGFVEKRITDRRNDGRMAEKPTLANLISLRYWKGLLYQQWLSLSLLAILYIIVFARLLAQ
jgi:serine/threonine-protein kinase